MEFVTGIEADLLGSLMLPKPLTVTVDAARRFVRRALLLDTPVPTVADALAHHGYIQIDPINVCGRMHDLIARNRVAGYREGDLMRHLHGIGAPLAAEQRLAFEHHIPSTGILVAFTLDAWPHLLAAMRARTRRAGPWSGRLSKRETELATRILEAIANAVRSTPMASTTTGARNVFGARPRWRKPPCRNCSSTAAC